MSPVTAACDPDSNPLQAFDGLLDLERSRSFHAGERPLGRELMEQLMAGLAAGLPDLQRPKLCLHVAGSEGKTSLTELLAAGLGAAGLSVGTYTSPHLRDPRERLRIDGQLPAFERLRPAVERVCKAAAREGLEPSWFEAMTATAFALFGLARLDAAVWETGLGGRLDATRALPADLCVLTTISLEHTAVLGDSLEAIAREKAGILRPGVPLVVGRGVPEVARDVVLAEAERLGCPWTLAPAADGEPWDVSASNQALALAALSSLEAEGISKATGVLTGSGRLSPDEPAVRAAVVAHEVEGRQQTHAGVLFDGAHTVAAVQALVARLAIGPRGPVVLGATSGRDAQAMARALLAVARPLVLTRAPGPRGTDPDELARELPDGDVLVEADPLAALAMARTSCPAEARIVVTGSLYLVGLLLPSRSEST